MYLSKQLLMKDLHSLTGKIEELRAGCPMQGCGVGKDGELGALWRRWGSVRRSVSILLAQTQQREEEWKDITQSVSVRGSFSHYLHEHMAKYVSFW